METKYIVRVNIFESEINGVRNSRNHEYIFEESNLIESRNKAIEQVKELTSFMTSGTKDKFTPLSEAQMDGVDFFHAFQIDLIFLTDDGHEYQIFGEESLMIEALEEEAEYYFINEINEQLFAIQKSIDEGAVILKSNYKFFIGNIKNWNLIKNNSL